MLKYLLVFATIKISYLYLSKHLNTHQMANFRKIEITISKVGHGQYVIESNYKGIHVKTHTTDSECFDWLEDDSNIQKHRQAKRHAYYKILSAYAEIKSQKIKTCSKIVKNAQA